MLAEIVLLLGIANIVLVYLIMRKLKEELGGAPVRTSKRKQKVEVEEEEEDDDDNPDEPFDDPVKIEETKPAPKSKISKFFSKKEAKQKRSVTEMPDMNRVIEELQSEFLSAEAPAKRKKGNEIEERINEIEQM